MATIEVIHASATSQVQGRPPRIYYPELDALRFMAFLAVYLSHSIPNAFTAKTSHAGNVVSQMLANIKDIGNFGVCLFFLLSAFLITDLLMHEYQVFGQVYIGAFYVRRILRIWPLYFGIIGLYGFGALLFPALRIEPGRIASYLLLAGNWYIVLHPWIQTPLRALWSISVEEQFYLLWPWLVRYCVGRTLMYLSILIVMASLFIVYMVSRGESYAYVTVWVNSFAQFQFFACGAFLALALKGHSLRIKATGRAAMLCAALLLWWIAAAIAQIKRPGIQASPYQFCFGYLLVAIGCVLIFLAMYGISAKRVPRPVSYLGKISFGLYVFHETAFLLVDEAQGAIGNLFPLRLWISRHVPYAVILNKSAALAITIMLAALSYRFWESPFLRLKRKVTFLESRGV